ncbi:MAG: hypothetical protein AAF604_14190 [Acidobacteriota bacterium]
MRWIWSVALVLSLLVVPITWGEPMAAQGTPKVGWIERVWDWVESFVGAGQSSRTESRSTPPDSGEPGAGESDNNETGPMIDPSGHSFH